MEQASEMRLGHLFTPLHALAPGSRLALSGLLSPDGSAPAIMPLEVADLALPSTEQSRHGLRAVIERGLGPRQLAVLRQSTLAEVVPPIAMCPGGPQEAGCPARLVAVLTRESVTTWESLGPLTIGEMTRWTGAGPQTIAALIGGAVSAALTTVCGPARTAPEADRPQSPEASALAVLLHDEKVTGRGDLRRALECLAAGDRAPEVKAAAGALLTSADQVGNHRLNLLDRLWAAVGDHRDRVVLAHRAIGLGGRTSITDLAAALDVSDARIGQIQARAEQRTHAAARLCGPAFETMADELRASLGPACPLSAVDEALAELGLPVHQDPRSMLLVWLAGPYVALGDPPAWVATDPVTLRAEARRALEKDGGVIRLDHVAADLERAGIARAHVDAWLLTQPVIHVDGLVVTRAGSAVDVAERILSATGRAMTEREIADLMPARHVPAVLGGRTMRHPRFVRVDQDRYELTEWGTPPLAPAELFPEAGRAKLGGRCQLQTAVDAAMLRGSAEAVPRSCVEALGIPIGGRRTFTTRFGPIVLNHNAGQPTRGSLRPVALAAGAKEGDLLVLEFDAAAGQASVELAVAPQSAAS